MRPGDEPVVPEGQPRRVPSKTWRALTKKIWEVAPLSCPRPGEISAFGQFGINTERGKSILQRIPHRGGHHRAASWWFLSSCLLKSAQNWPRQYQQHPLPKNPEKAICYRLSAGAASCHDGKVFAAGSCSCRRPEKCLGESLQVWRR